MPQPRLNRLHVGAIGDQQRREVVPQVLVAEPCGQAGDSLPRGAKAMPPDQLRGILSSAIREHIDARQWELELAVEQEERRSLASMLGGAE